MVIFPISTSVAPVCRAQPKNRYYVIISPKLTSVAQVPEVQTINANHVVFFLKITSVAVVSLLQPINTYYMEILPKINISCRERERERESTYKFSFLRYAIKIPMPRRTNISILFCETAVSSYTAFLGHVYIMPDTKCSGLCHILAELFGVAWEGTLNHFYSSKPIP